MTDSGGASDTTFISIMVGTPPEPPVGVSMYVASITMQMKGPHLDTIVTIHADTDGGGAADETDSPVADVVPVVSLCATNPSGDCFFESTTAATNSNGSVKYKLLKPPVNTEYTLTVHGVTDGTGTFVYDDTITGDEPINSYTTN